jgi:hypothetical protein
VVAAQVEQHQVLTAGQDYFLVLLVHQFTTLLEDMVAVTVAKATDHRALVGHLEDTEWAEIQRIITTTANKEQME